MLHPMGWDAFGLPAENAAIKSSTHPREWTNTNIAELRQGAAVRVQYDWGREISTCEPEYYRWNQWFFLRCSSAGSLTEKEPRELVFEMLDGTRE